MGTSKDLANARKVKNDEYFTRLTDIEKEMVHYKSEFNGKWVYSNCDDPRRSQFVRYFLLNFEHLGLAGYEASGLDANGIGWHLQYTGGVDAGDLDQWIEDNVVEVEDGRYQSDASLEALARCDIVVTNPPFSIFNEYIDVLLGSGKKFLIIGSMLAAKNKAMFPKFTRGDLWIGVNGLEYFFAPGGEKTRAPGRWYTNLSHRKRAEEIPLYAKYNETDYPKYDNYDAINVDWVKEIPADYDGVMGVPVSFLDHHTPSQFKILGVTASWDECAGIKTGGKGRQHAGWIGAREVPVRILVKRV